MYIAPDSTIRVLKNVPLDNSYRNTIYFDSKTAQENYFLSMQKYAVSNYTYQRLQKTLRIGILADNLYDCNYIMFQNSAFGSKWFYAFIIGVEYINNETSEISFEMDIMQTWNFDYTLNQCFVEREHSATDGIGDNLIPENLELGEYIARDFLGTEHLGNRKIVMACTFNKELVNVAGGTYGGIYSGLIFNVFDTYEDANAFIESATNANKSSGIISCFMMPADFIASGGQAAKNYDIEFTKNTADIDGYVPKNKKLFTYPYNFLYCTNLDGNACDFKYEYFDDDVCTFGLAGDTSCNPQVILYPQNYKGILANYNEKMCIEGFPQCPFTTDTFKAWLAQNASSLSVSVLGSAFSSISGATKMAYGDIGGAAQAESGLMSIATTIAKVSDTASLPRQAHGSTGSSAATAIGIKDFAFMHMTIRSEFAKIIDDFFTVYGYSSHRVKMPNTHSRPHWNFIKTKNCCLTGSLPAEHMAKIRSIYDAGITFWKNGNEIGNYSLDNSI